MVESGIKHHKPKPFALLNINHYWECWDGGYCDAKFYFLSQGNACWSLRTI